jgi:oligopeptide transport system substrate-binding protein
MRWGGLGLLLALTSLAAASQVPARAAEKAVEQVLRRGNGSEPESLDPAKVESVQASRILNDLFEGLITLDASDRPVPAAASSWQVSPDGLVYTFHLRAGLQWSDGSPLTAEDFVYGIRRVVDPASQSASAFLTFPIKNAEAIASGRIRDLGELGVQALDAVTLRFTLERPTPYWVAAMSHPKFLPVKRANVEAYGASFTQPGKLVSNGPFNLQDWTPQSRLVLVKNPRFHDAASVHLDKVIFQPIESETEEFNRFRAGELDVTYFVPSQQTDLIRQNMAAELRTEPSLTMDYLAFNMGRAPLGTMPALRRALSMVIDRQALVDKIVKTGAPVAYSVVPAVGLPGYIDQSADWAWLPMADKIVTARQIFAAAGYDERHPLELDLRIMTGDNVRKIANAVAGMWQSALGVKVAITAEDFNTLVEHRHRRSADLQVFWYAWTADYPDATTFLDLFTSTSPENDTGYANPAYDKLIAEAETMADENRRIGLLQDAEEILVNDNPVMPLYTRTQPYLIKPWVRGYHIDPCGLTFDKDVTILPH